MKLYSALFRSLLCLIAINAISLSIPRCSFAQEQAKSADAFVGTIGVNTHIGWANSPYTNYTSLKSALVGLGVRHIRDGINYVEDFGFTSDILDLGTAGIRLQGVLDGYFYPTPYGTTPLSSTDVVSRITTLTPAIETVEGPNETDWSTSFAYNGKGGFPAGTIAFSQDLYSIVKGSTQTSALPVLLSSIGNASRMPQVEAITPGPIGYADYGDIHSYPGGQIADNGIDWCLGYAAGLTGTKPIICGETGYHNNTAYLGAVYQPGVSEAAAGKYMPAVFLEMYNRGILRCFAYELVDQYSDPSFADGTGEDHYGLLHYDWTPKPAYTALQNMIGILKEPGASFTPGALTYSVSSIPSTVHHTLLEKSNGTFYLALWNDVSCYQSNTGSGGADITNGTVPATITLPTANAFTVYSPSDASGASPTSAYTSGSTSNSITLNIPDRVLLVQIGGTAPPPPSLPDLTVSSISWTPTSPASGNHVVFSCVVKNIGSVATPSGTVVGVQFAIDGSESVITWSDTDTTSLAPGATVTLTCDSGTNGVNYWAAVSGTHTVQAWVDDVNRIAESNENNNKLTAQITVGTGGSVPSAPTGLTATGGNAQVSLSWAASSGATSYNVYRGVTANGEGSTAIATGITSTGYTNTLLTNGTTYYYKVAAVNSTGTSALSSEASITPQTASALQLQYQCQSTVTPAIFIGAGFNIVNNGSSSIPYSQLKVRYWYTEDGTASQVFECYTAPMGTANVTGTFVTMGTPTSTADHYVEIAFTSGAGSLAANSSSGMFTMQLNRTDYSGYTLTNDWSWNVADRSLTNWSNVTLYQNGTLVWGTEPH